MEFLHNYGGGWQELLPSCNDACTLPRRAAAVPRRGRHRPVGRHDRLGRRRRRRADRPRALRAHAVRARAAHAARARAGDADAARAGREPLDALRTISSGATTAWSARRSWRQGAGCTRRRARSSRSPEIWEDTARLASGQREPWPHALLQGRRARSTCARCRAPRRAATTTCSSPISRTGRSPSRIRSSAARSGCASTTRCSAGSSPGSPTAARTSSPLEGSYALGIEPWVSLGNLEQAVADGEAIELGGRRVARDDPDRHHRGRTRSMRSARVLETAGCDALRRIGSVHRRLAHRLRGRRDLGPEPVRGAAARRRALRRLGRRDRERGRGARARGRRLRGRRLRGLHAGPARRLRRSACGARVASG